LKTDIKRSRFIFDKYYKKTEDSPAYADAIILHPSRKVRYIQRNWKRDLQTPALNGVKKLWESYCELDALDLSTASDEISLLAGELDFVDMAGRDLDNDRGSRADEYGAYLSRDHGKIKGSALDWWLRDEQWPRLSQMAIDILSIPAMSDEPERVFSGARRTISWSRAKTREHSY
jgi:hypothetical protein